MNTAIPVRLSERLNTPISTTELERRWKAVRAAMERDKIDVLLMQNNNDHMGGYVRYFTDVPATNGYPITAVFPRDDLMTIVMHGGFGMAQNIAPGGNGILRGVKTVLGTPSFACAPYPFGYDPELAAKALAPYADGTIGLVSTYQMSFAMVDNLKRGGFSNTRFVEATDLVDTIKAIKSKEEMQRIRDCARMQDGAMKAAFAALKPGMKDSEVAAAARYYSHVYGSEQGIYMCNSAAPGEPAKHAPSHFQNRTIREGDTLALLVEDNGPGGYYAELGRLCVVGKASEQLKDEFAFALEARRFTLNMLQPGTPCRDIWHAYNDFMRHNGRPPEDRVYCHGQGYDLVERPLIRHDETMAIERNTNLACHPGFIRNGCFAWICDNYVLGETGSFERIHAFPETITEI